MDYMEKDNTSDVLKRKDCEDYVGICRREYWHPAIKKFHKARHFSKWALKLLVPDFLIGHPNLWDNLKTLRKNPQFKPLRMLATAWLIFTLVAGSAGIYILSTAPGIFAADFTDDTQAEFNAGTYSGTQWDATNSWVELSAPPTSGNYTSSVKDAGSDSSWNNIAWVPERPTGKELPNSAASETAYTSGNANMTGNVLLMHMNESTGTIIDTSGQGNNGAYNGALYSQTGKLNTAIGFDGTDDYVNIADNASWNFGDNPFTISLWVNHKELGNDTFVGNNEGGGTVNKWMFYRSASNISFHFNGPVPGGQTPFSYAWTPALNNWNYISLTRNGSAYALYIDGVQVATGTNATTIADANAPLTIGFGEAGYYFNGTIDEVAIYNRALSPTEVADHYKRGALRLKYQVRSGATNPPTGNFIGPDGTITDYYKWGTTNSVGTPTFALTNVANNRYFQYKGFFETDNTSYSPELKSVTTNYTVLNQPPNTPTNSLPANAAIRQLLTPTLTSSAFSDPNPADTHAASQWQITTTLGNYTSPTYDSGTDTTNKTSITIPSSTLTYATTYYWHVKHKDNIGDWSSYSTQTSFTTAAQPNTPTNSSPTNGAFHQILTPTLTSSAFSHNDPGATHSASQWLIRNLSDPTYATPVYDSGTDATNKTSITVPASELSVNTTYFWKVRYKDDLDYWSSYSSETAFSTGVVPITVVAVGATEYTSGEIAKLTVQVTNADGAPVNTATVTINVYSPANVKLVNGASMTYIAASNGLYYYNYTIPATVGVYIYDATATYSGLNGYSSHTFHVAQFASDVTSIKSTVESEETAQTAERIAQEASRVKVEDVQTKTTDIQTKTTDIQTKVTDIQTKTNTISANLDILIGAFIVTQSSVNDASPSVTSFITALTNSTNNFYKNSVLTFTSGSLNGQVRRISAYNGTTKTITLDPALTSAPANGDTFTIVKQNVRVEEQAANIQTDVTYTRNKVDSIYTLLGTVDTNLSSVQTAVNSIRTSQQKAYKAELSNVSQVQTENTYRAKLILLDYEDNPVDAATTPKITIYDSTRAVKANAQNMTNLSMGVYEYTYDILSTDATGLWEAVVTTAVGSSADQTLNDYFDVTGSPAQVFINSVSTTIPSISANVKITNEGSGAYEYHYEWCVVADQDNQCGGNDDVYYASASKLIQAGQDFITNLTSTVPTAGTYWFKLVVYYGTQASGASRQFTASVAPAISSGSYAPIQMLTVNALSAQIQTLQKSIDMESSRMSRVLDVLGIIKPIIVSGNKQLNNVKDVQNKLADLQAVSSSIRQIVESNSASPVVETYMKFNSVVISFLITNPANSKQTVNFKSFLPAEVKMEEIMDLDGLKLDYDTNANSYFVSGNISLGPKQSITKIVEIKDIWIFEQSDFDSIKKQAESFAEALKNTQYSAQGVLLKNDIESSINRVENSQKLSYSSPQDHILTYRNNKILVQKTENNLDKLKDLVVQAGASQGLVGKIGGIQTFATWGIILAIIFGFGLLAMVIFAMWRHQMTLFMASMGLDKEILAELGRRKKHLREKSFR